MNPNQSRALRIYLIFNALTSLAYSMIFTLYNVYVVTTAGLDPLQLVLLGTALELSVFVFEVPTGVVADVFSRRLSILIGLVLIGIGFVVTGVFPSFWLILFGQVLWGLGFTFTSGAQQAWISDEIGEERAAAAFLRGAQLENVGALAGVAVGRVILS
jgi:DHA3 family tetracycline resistance protein-like MFS transporter